VKKEFKTLVLPVLKGLPIIILLIIAALSFAARGVMYMVPEYQSISSIRIDGRNINLSELALFEEEGRTKGVAQVDLLTEIEVFKSKRLKEHTFQKLNFHIDYFRVGNVKTKELYTESPIKINYEILDEQAYDKLFYLKYAADGKWFWSKTKEEFLQKNIFSFGDTIDLSSVKFHVSENEKILLDKPHSLRANDVFAFRMNSIEGLVKSVINLYYQHEVAEKAALFLNTLMEAYIENCKQVHKDEADRTLTFIDARLEEVKRKLKRSEGRLVKYKTQKNIINIKQETDATLKEMMQLEFQKVNYDLQEAELKKTYEYLLSGNDLRDFAPNFDALKDPLFKEAFVKAQNYEIELQDLLLKYMPISDEVQSLKAKINKMRTFINESVKNTLENIGERRASMEATIANVEQSITEFPDKEQQTMVLEREVKLNEQLYTNLIEKKMEIGVARSANTVFHQVIDAAEANEKPVSPNKPLAYGVAVFLALLIGIALSFLKHHLTSRLKTKGELMELFSAPVIGVVSKADTEDESFQALGNLYTNLELIQNGETRTSKTVLVSSMLPNEGKTFTTINLAKVFASMGKRVLLVDIDTVNPSLHQLFEIENEGGLNALLRKDITPQQAVKKTRFKNLDFIPSGNIENIYSGILFAPQTIRRLESIKANYDIILIDTPPVGMVEDVSLLMQQVDQNLLVFRERKTKLKTVNAAQKMVEEFDIPNVYSVLNFVRNRKHVYYYKAVTKRNKVWDAVAAMF